jgi:hypothetical protein
LGGKLLAVSGRGFAGSLECLGWCGCPRVSTLLDVGELLGVLRAQRPPVATGFLAYACLFGAAIGAQPRQFGTKLAHLGCRGFGLPLRVLGVGFGAGARLGAGVDALLGLGPCVVKLGRGGGLQVCDRVLAGVPGEVNLAHSAPSE